MLLAFFSKRIGKSLSQAVFLPTLNSNTICCDHLSPLVQKSQALEFLLLGIKSYDSPTFSLVSRLQFIFFTNKIILVKCCSSVLDLMNSDEYNDQNQPV